MASPTARKATSTVIGRQPTGWTTNAFDKRQSQDQTMAMDHEIPVTGLGGLPRTSVPKHTVAVEETPVEPAPPVNIIGLGDDFVAKVPEINQAQQVYEAQLRVAHPPQPAALTGIAPDYEPDLYQRAHDDNLKRDFLEAVGQRNSFAPSSGGHNNPPAYIPPPIPDRVAEQTRLEMEAGRQAVANAKADSERLAGIRRANQQKDAAQNGHMKTVFNPDDYVPKMNQGHIPTQTNRNVG